MHPTFTSRSSPFLPSQMNAQGQGPGGLTLVCLRLRTRGATLGKSSLTLPLPSGSTLQPHPFLPGLPPARPKVPTPTLLAFQPPLVARLSPSRRSFTPRGLGGRDSRTWPALRARGRAAGWRGLTPLTQRAQHGGAVVVGSGGGRGGGGRGGGGGDGSRDGGGGAEPGPGGMRRPRRASG